MIHIYDEWWLNNHVIEVYTMLLEFAPLVYQPKRNRTFRSITEGNLGGGAWLIYQINLGLSINN